MTDFIQWFLDIPKTLAEFGGWLTTPISDQFQVTPLAMLGTGALVAVIAIVGFKVVHLVNPFG